MAIDDLLNHPEAMKTFGSMPETEKYKIMGKLEPAFHSMTPERQAQAIRYIQEQSKVQPSQFNEKPLSDSPSAGLALMALPGGAAMVGADAASKVGEAVAEKGGEMGHPIAGAAAGTAVSMAPLAAMAKPVASAAMNVAEDVAPFAERVKNALFGSLKDTGKKLGAVEEAVVGPQSQRVMMTPKEKDVIGMIKGSKDTVNEIKRSGYLPEDWTPQKLIEMKDTLGKAIKEGVVSLETREGALASQMKADIESILNNVVDGRRQLSQQYSDILKRNDLFKKAGMGTAITGGLGLAYEGGKRLLK